MIELRILATAGIPVALDIPVVKETLKLAERLAVSRPQEAHRDSQAMLDSNGNIIR